MNQEHDIQGEIKTSSRILLGTLAKLCQHLAIILLLHFKVQIMILNWTSMSKCQLKHRQCLQFSNDKRNFKFDDEFELQLHQRQWKLAKNNYLIIGEKMQF